MKIPWASGLLIALGIADTLSTVWLVQSGKAIEANPVMRFYFDAGVFWFMWAKILLLIAPLFVLELIRLQRPKLVQNLLCLGIVLYLLCYGIGVWQVNHRNGATQSAETACQQTNCQ
jgi:hypothetical protein